MKNRSAQVQASDTKATEIHIRKTLDIFAVGINDDGKSEKLLTAEALGCQVWLELGFNTSDSLANCPVEIRYKRNPPVSINSKPFENLVSF